MGIGPSWRDMARTRSRALRCRIGPPSFTRSSWTDGASALRWCRSEDRHRQAALENNLADLHHVAGDEDNAMIHLKRAVSIFSEVGADEATRLPAIWKLVSW